MRWPAKVKILVPGKIKFPFIKEGIFFYQRRIQNYLDLEVEEKKVGKSKGPFEAKRLEGETLLKGLSPKSFKIALDERGVLWDSSSFATHFGEILDSKREIIFLLGGAYGLDDKVLAAADLKLSLSKLTLNHEIALLVLLEQLYRALSILSGEPYHK